jgi:hypothetical protein
MSEWYPPFAAAIRKGGFYTNGVERRDGLERTTVSSQGSRGVLGGNSFWVTKLAEGWYLGTWGAQYYRLPEEHRIVELCLSWCTRFPRGTYSDFDDQLKQEFGLIKVSEEELDRAIGQVGPKA